ncbi:class I SAM-dependent methyltransferase [Prosthecobacter sp.]|uniref:class I SAM-dependent methyltransferase n=1 Tax=Prosthecobacter sp. TaxID=1965333 RepID=UPI00378367B9
MTASPITHQCPLTGAAGQALRTRQPDELFGAYATYCRFPLTEALREKYFREPVTEYFAAESGLRWYSPSRLGDSDFYERLSSFPDYYNPASWDKLEALRMVRESRPSSVVDVGCGDAWLVREIQSSGIKAMGTDLNEEAIAKGRAEGLDVHLPDSPEIKGRHAEVMISLQTLEHVHEPVAWLQAQVQQFQPKTLILAVPAHDTMLGRSTEPLCWPPHHFTLWSAKAMKVLAQKIGYQLSSVDYEPNSWRRFNGTLNREGRRNLDGTMRFPKSRTGALLYDLMCLLRKPWARRAHSLIAVLHRS